MLTVHLIVSSPSYLPYFNILSSGIYWAYHNFVKMLRFSCVSHRRFVTKPMTWLFGYSIEKMPDAKSLIPSWRTGATAGYTSNKQYMVRHIYFGEIMKKKLCFRKKAIVNLIFKNTHHFRMCVFVWYVHKIRHIKWEEILDIQCGVSHFECLNSCLVIHKWSYAFNWRRDVRLFYNTHLSQILCAVRLASFALSVIFCHNLWPEMRGVPL